MLSASRRRLALRQRLRICMSYKGLLSVALIAHSVILVATSAMPVIPVIIAATGVAGVYVDLKRQRDKENDK